MYTDNFSGPKLTVSPVLSQGLGAMATQDRISESILYDRLGLCFPSKTLLSRKKNRKSCNKFGARRGPRTLVIFFLFFFQVCWEMKQRGCKNSLCPEKTTIRSGPGRMRTMVSGKLYTMILSEGWASGVLNQNLEWSEVIDFCVRNLLVSWQKSSRSPTNYKTSAMMVFVQTSIFCTERTMTNIAAR